MTPLKIYERRASVDISHKSPDLQLIHYRTPHREQRGQECNCRISNPGRYISVCESFPFEIEMGLKSETMQFKWTRL